MDQITKNFGCNMIELKSNILNNINLSCSGAVEVEFGTRITILLPTIAICIQEVHHKTHKQISV